MLKTKIRDKPFKVIEIVNFVNKFIAEFPPFFFAVAVAGFRFRY